MSRKKVLPKHKVIDAQAMSADIYSESTILEGLDHAKYHFEISNGSSPNGIVKLQITDDNEDVADADANWITVGLDIGDGITISADGDEGLIHIREIAFKRARLFYDWTSGNGTLNAWIKAGSKGA